MSNARSAAATQAQILIVVAALWCANAVLALPPRHRAMALAGAGMFFLAWWLAPRFPIRPRGRELLGVAVVALLPFLLLLARDVPATRLPSLLAACLGALTVLGFWVVARFPLARPVAQTVWERLFMGVFAGFALFFVLALVSLILLVLVFIVSPPERGATLDLARHLLPGYFRLALVGAVVGGLLIPFASYPLARLLLGTLGGVGFYASALPALRFVLDARGEAPLSTLAGAAVAIVGGLLLGPAVAFSVQEP